MFIRFVLLQVPSIKSTDTSSSIGDSEDELGRMLAVLRFWFTKDLVRCHRLRGRRIVSEV